MLSSACSISGFPDNNSPWASYEDYNLDTTLIHLAVDRKSSQKPLDELYAAFKLAHPDVGPGTGASTSAAAIQSSASATGALSDPIMDHRCDNYFLLREILISQYKRVFIHIDDPLHFFVTCLLRSFDCDVSSC